MNAPAPITVTTLDNERLRQIIDRHARAGTRIISPLSQALTTARIVAPTGVGREVATINSRVVYRIRESQNHFRVLSATLVTPMEADNQLGRVSVLAATGSALLGLAEGDSIEWPDEAGQLIQYTLLRVIYQPEAAGRFDL